MRGLTAAFLITAVVTGCGDSSSDDNTGNGASSPDTLSEESYPEEVQALLASFPPIEVEPPLLDFGEVQLANPVTKHVKLINTSDKRIRIADSTSNCGCTTPDMSGVVIEPNSSTNVPVHFDAEGRTGDRSAVVTIIVDDYEQPVKFKISAFVTPE